MTPQPTAGTEEFVTVAKPVSVQIPHGTTTLQPGMKLRVLSRGTQTVDVRYLNARYTIPISTTDAK